MPYLKALKKTLPSALFLKFKIVLSHVRSLRISELLWKLCKISCQIQQSSGVLLSESPWNRMCTPLALAQFSLNGRKLTRQAVSRLPQKREDASRCFAELLHEAWQRKKEGVQIASYLENEINEAQPFWWRCGRRADVYIFVLLSTFSARYSQGFIVFNSSLGVVFYTRRRKTGCFAQTWETLFKKKKIGHHIAVFSPLS